MEKKPINKRANISRTINKKDIVGQVIEEVGKLKGKDKINMLEKLSKIIDKTDNQEESMINRFNNIKINVIYESDKNNIENSGEKE